MSSVSLNVRLHGVAIRGHKHCLKVKAAQGDLLVLDNATCSFVDHVSFNHALVNNGKMKSRGIEMTCNASILESTKPLTGRACGLLPITSDFSLAAAMPSTQLYYTTISPAAVCGARLPRFAGEICRFSFERVYAYYSTGMGRANPHSGAFKYRYFGAYPKYLYPDIGFVEKYVYAYFSSILKICALDLLALRIRYID